MRGQRLAEGARYRHAVDEYVLGELAARRPVDVRGLLAVALANVQADVRLNALNLALGEIAPLLSTAAAGENEWQQARRVRLEQLWPVWLALAPGLLKALPATDEELARGLIDLALRCADHEALLGHLIAPAIVDALFAALRDPWLQARCLPQLGQIATRLVATRQPALIELRDGIGTLLRDGPARACDFVSDNRIGKDRLAELCDELRRYVLASADRPELRANQLVEARSLLACSAAERYWVIALSLIEDRIEPLGTLTRTFDYFAARARQKLRAELVRKPVEADVDDMRRLLEHMARIELASESQFYDSLLRWVMRHAREQGVDERLRPELSALITAMQADGDDYAPSRKLLKELSSFVTSVGMAEQPKFRFDDDCWGVPAAMVLQASGYGGNEAVLSWLLHCQNSSGTSPSAKWQRELRQLVTDTNADARALARDLLLTLLKPRLADPELPAAENRLLLSEPSGDTLKGIAWSALVWSDDEMAACLREGAVAAFKKIPNFGARSVKVGNACVAALSMWPGMSGARELCTLKSLLKQPSARATVDKALNRAAQQLGLSLQDLDEISTSTHELVDGERALVFGRYTCRIALDARGVGLSWFEADRALRTEPASIRKEYSAQRGSLKLIVKDMERSFAATRMRLERLLASERSWSREDFHARFVDHPFVSQLARSLVWTLQVSESAVAGLFREGGWFDIEGQPIQMDCISKVSPWHPALVPADEVRRWRQQVRERGLRQPFKQVYREVYRITDAELRTESYSNRFAAHVLRQHVMASVCQSRGWMYKLMGSFDSGSPCPTFQVPHHALSAEFWVHQASDGQDAQTAMGISIHVLSDQVRFYALSADGRDRRPLRLVDVAPAVFSEVMRDVDLLVAVSSIGADPSWVDHGAQDRFAAYFRSYSFGELGVSGESRKELLGDILPALTSLHGIAHIDGQYLVVQGKIRTYRIHLGSGNILMSPNDQYLCIVQDRAAKDEALAQPLLEGDHLLSMILSKALLLARDDRISDASIVRQIAP